MRALGWTAAGLLLLLVLTFVLVPPLSRPLVRNRVFPAVSSQIGLEVHADDAWVQLLPVPAVHVRELTVSRKDGGTVLAAHAADAEVSLWRAIVSGGKELRLHDLSVKQPTLNLSMSDLRKLAHQSSQESSGERELSFESFRIEGARLNLEELGTALVHELDVEGVGAGTGGKLSVSFHAAVLSDESNASGELELTKGGAPTGSARLTGASLRALAPLLPGGVHPDALDGTVTWASELRNSDEGGWTLAGDARLSEVHVHGVGPFEGRAHLRVSVMKGGRLSAELSDASLNGHRGELTAEASMTSEPLRGRVTATIRRLDLHGLEPQHGKQSQPGTPELHESTRGRLRSAALEVSLSAEELRFRRAVVSGLQAKGSLQHGVLRFSRLSARAFGGEIDAAGSHLDVSQAHPSFLVKAKSSGFDAEKATSALLGTPLVEGTMSGTLELSGTGRSYSELRSSLRGRGDFRIADWALADRPEAHRGPLRKLLSHRPHLRRERTFSGSFTLEGGAVHLERPVPLELPLPPAPPVAQVAPLDRRRGLPWPHVPGHSWPVPAQ